MSKTLKKILTASSALLMIAGIGVTSSNGLTANAKRHYRTHRVYRHHARRRVRHHRARYHFANHNISYKMPAYVIRNVKRTRLGSRASYINWYAKNINRANSVFYDRYSSKAKAFNQGWSDSTNPNSVTYQHIFNTSEISNPYYRLGVFDGIADTLDGGTSTGSYNVKYKTMNRAVNLVLKGIKYANKTHAADVGLNNSNTAWSWDD